MTLTAWWNSRSDWVCPRCGYVSVDQGVHDSVCYRSGCTWENTWRLIWAFPWDRGISLKQPSCWLWYPIWYQLFHKFTPLQTDLTLEYSHLCLLGDLAHHRGLRFVFLSVVDKWGFPLLVFPPSPDQPGRIRNRPWWGIGTPLPAQHSTPQPGRCFMGVTASSRKANDRLTWNIHLFCMLSHSSLVSRAPWALSYLLFLSRLLANCDICSKMKAWGENLNVNILATDRQNEQTEECLSLLHYHPSNERLQRLILCWRNDHF